jgi:fibronectin-binding autotransporter adhesin
MRRSRRVLTALSIAGMWGWNAAGARAAPTLTSFYLGGEFATNSGFTTGAESLPISNTSPTVYVPVGDYFEFGVSAVITNNPNSTAGDAWDQANQALGNPAQPAMLGMGIINYIVGSTDAGAALLAPVEGTYVGSGEYDSTAVLPNSNLAMLSGPGDVESGNGFVGSNQPLFQGNFAVNPDTAMGVAELALFAGGAATALHATTMFTQLSYHALGAGLVGLLPSAAAAASGDDYWVPNSAGTVNGSNQVTSDASYSLDQFSAGGTINDPAVLAVIIAPGVTWDGQADHTTWNTSAANWNNGSNPNSTYADSDIAMFTDSAPSNATSIALNSTVFPDETIVSGSSNNYTISGSGAIAGAGVLIKENAGTLMLDTANTFTGGTTVMSGTLVVGVHGALPNSGLAITGGKVQLAANTGAMQLTSLSISPGGVLDIGNNHVILSDPGGGIDSAIRGYLADGYNAGNWSGTSGGAIMTSAATGSTYGLGYADGADGGISGITAGQLEVKYTLYGDANLDGSVNSVDFGDLAANFGKSGKLWDQGDFNYDGTVNSLDFGMLASNFGKSLGSAGDAVTSAEWTALSAFASANDLTISVPEPTFVGVFLIGTTILVSRRRRLNKTEQN